MLCTRLYLGRSISALKPLTVNTFDTIGAREVTDADLDVFLRDTVAPLFQGFMVYTAKGYWRGAPENTTILEFIHEKSDTPKTQKIAEIYTLRFNQESALCAVSELVI